MIHTLSSADTEFKKEVESCTFPIPNFDHRAHLRLAYIYLVENDTEKATQAMRSALLGLLKKAGIDPSGKFHETLTRAWVLAVKYFMNHTGNSESADEFIDKNPRMLDSKIMLSHYSAEVIFSDKARKEFVEPNLEPIPTNNQGT
ncbi:hypothetical protein QP938_03235 [Porticoccaceae bacterium LTM1]|nr:hypothetical protein QP938_03235 [Porticoccaceae bacterium LTM1]